MGKKKGILRKVGNFVAAPVKFIGKVPREALRIVDQGLGLANKAIEKTGLDKVLAGGGSVGVSTTSGSHGGTNVHYSPAASSNSIGIGLSNSGNASLFINNDVAASFTLPKANFTDRSTERIIIESNENHTINSRISERDELLTETYGPGYIPESSLATIGAVAIGSAAKEFLQDSIQVANAMSNLYLDTYIAIHSANEEQRAEAWARNQELAANAGKAVSKVIHNPEIVSMHYNNRAQDASNSFAAAYDAGNLIGAGAAAGHVVYDVYTISTATLVLRH